MPFPIDTTISDTFSGGAASPPSASWSGKAYSTHSALRQNGSGVCVPTTPTLGASGAWLGSAPSDVDAGLQITLAAAGVQQFTLLGFRLSNIGTSLCGYEIASNASLNQLLYLRIDNEVETLLGAIESLPSTFADGDWLGGRMLGTTLQAYYSTAAGGITGFAATGAGRTGLAEYNTGSSGIIFGAEPSSGGGSVDNWFLADLATPTGSLAGDDDGDSFQFVRPA